jgi:bifunctional polynucleotide phosphatase/kinase
MTWSQPDTGLEIYSYKFSNISSRIACFDMDGTLIKTKSGKKFPINEDDWCWLTVTVPDRIKEINENYSIIIMSNQSKFNNGLKTKIENICSTLDIPLLVLVSTDYTKYRKPMPGFMDYLNNVYKDTIDIHNSFFVGDAMDNNFDHSNCDLYFALNTGLKFHFSHHFFKTDDKKQMNRVVPSPIKPQLPIIPKEQNIQDYDKYNIIILVGPPAVGKSYLSEELVASFGYVRLSQDDFSTKPKFLKEVAAKCRINAKIIIDNTNRNRTTREGIINHIIANWNPNMEHKIAVIEVNPSPSQREIAEYLNHYRCYTTGKWIPSIVYNTYYKQYEDPRNDNLVNVDTIISYYPPYKDLPYYF